MITSPSQRLLPALALVALLLVACDAQQPATPPASAVASTAAAPQATSAPTSEASAEGDTSAREYDLGPATIEQAEVVGERRSLPYRLQGLIAAPPGGGRHPLVLVLHGSHAGCPAQEDAGDLPVDTWPCPLEQEQRNDRGWRYLLEELARQGYVAVAPNLNAIHTAAWGANGSTYERFAAVLDAQLARLAAADQGAEAGFGLDLAGRIDLERTALVGHSQGGGYAMLYAAERAAAPKGAVGGPLAATLLVAPVLQLAHPEAPGDPVPAPDLPLGIVMGLCDGDVAGLEGFSYYEAARAAPQRAHSVKLVMPYGANHNFFNAALGPDGLDPLGAPGCDRPAGRLTPAQQQAFLAAYARDFFAEVFGGAAPPAAWRADAPAPQRLYDTPVLTVLLAPSAQRQALVDLAAGQLPVDPGGIVVMPDPSLDVAVCGAAGATCRLDAYAIPTFEAVSAPALRLSWERPGGALRLTLPAGRRDLSSFAAIQLRVALDAFQAASGGGQALRLELRDAAGRRATVTVPAETLALQPPSAEVRDAAGPSPYLRGVAPLAAVRVPLAGFTGIDLTRVEQLALVFDQSERGALFVSDLELLR